MNPWIIVGFLVALIAVGAGGYMKGETDGRTAEHNQWETREASINADAAVKIKAADDKVIETERAGVKNVAAIDAKYQGKIQEKDNALTVALNAVKSGAVRLSGHGATCATVAGNATGAVGTSPSGGDGAAPSRLLNESDWVFLQSEAGRADKIVEQLTACQGVVIADRKR